MGIHDAELLVGVRVFMLLCVREDYKIWCLEAGNDECEGRNGLEVGSFNADTLYLCE